MISFTFISKQTLEDDKKKITSSGFVINKELNIIEVNINYIFGKEIQFLHSF